MSAISATKIGENRYAPEGANAIEVFNFNGVEGMTIGRLMAAVCVNRAAVLERISVVQMNQLSNTNVLLETLCGYAEKILAADNAAYTGTIRKALIQYGASESIPATITGYTDRMSAFEAVQNLLTANNSKSDRIAIELQSQISRRDTVYTIASNTVTHFGQSAMLAAGSMKGK